MTNEVSALVGWYEQHRRELPWRGERDPYRVWVSEVMLQQTQVNTVIPYYERFLTHFPTMEALAAAPLEAVLKAWEGLGYYRRARYLHQAAITVQADYGGALPNDYATLRKLPGFGDYTAGAVASIAFGQAVPAVDGNVSRVLARRYAIRTDISRHPAKKELHQQAQRLVETAHAAGYPPAEWTQALMELGALICTPQTPRCPDCPLQATCQAYRQGIAHELPVKSARKALPHYDVAAAVIRQADKFLIAQRPLDGMLGGLWEFPGGKQEVGESLPDCLRREIQEELGVDIEVADPITVVKHSYTHFKITLHAFYAHLTKNQQPQPLGVADWRWVTWVEMQKFPFPRTDQQIITAIQKQFFHSNHH